MMLQWQNNKKWNIAVLSALSPGMGQWYNNQLYKAIVFLVIHSCSIVWLWTPLLASWHLSNNQKIAAIASLTLWILSILDAYIYSGDSSIPFFSIFTSMRVVLGIATVTLLAALTALNLSFPDPVLKGAKISILIPTIPIAAAVVFDPFTGGVAGLTAFLIQICLHENTLSAIIILQCLSIMNACAEGTLIGKKKYQLAGLSAIVPDIADVFLSSGRISSAIIFPVIERLIIHWIVVTSIVVIMLLIKRWYFLHSINISQNDPGLKATQVNSFDLKASLLEDTSEKDSESISDQQSSFSTMTYQNESTKASGNELWDRLLDTSNLTSAWERVKANNSAPGIDGIKVDDFAMNAEGNINALQSILIKGQYEPLPLKNFNIPKASGGVRQLCIPTVRDRIVQQALVQILTPIFDPTFLDCSFAYRPGKSTHDALKLVEQQLRQGNDYILDADIKSFFDTVEHSILYKLIEEKVKDGLLLDLIKRFLASQMKGIGIPQGTATSPLYANIYLHVLDKAMTEAGYLLTRYADDFIVLTASSDNARSALNTAYNVLDEQLHLLLNQEKTRICSLKDGFVFLGYHFDQSGKRASEDAIETLSSRIHEKVDGFIQKGETPVTAFDKVRSSLRGWCNYFGVDVNQLLNDQPSSQSSIIRNASGFSEEHISQFLKLFQGRSGVYARQWVTNDGRNGYVPIKQAMSNDAVKSHFAGEITLASYVINQENMVSFMVIDIDGELGQLKAIEDTHDMALRIKELGSKHGLSIYIEESGSKGRHCWLFFASSMPASEAHQFGKLLIMKTAVLVPPSNGRTDREHNIMCEIFPKQEHISPNALGSLIKLPLGVHQVTKKRCLFLGDDGHPVSDQGGFLMRIRKVSEEAIRGAMARLSGKTPVTTNSDIIISPNIQQMLNGCRVLKYLVNKVKEVKHLNHTERLILLYTFGHLGEEGSCFIHHIMNNCDNYNSNVTQKWLNRMEAGHLPISCAKIKDWLYDVIQEIGCACSGNLYQGKYPSPLYYATTIIPENDQSNIPYSKDKGGRMTDEKVEIHPSSVIPQSLESGEKGDFKAPIDKPDDDKNSDLDDVWKEIEEDIFSEGE